MLNVVRLFFSPKLNTILQVGVLTQTVMQGGKIKSIIY